MRILGSLFYIPLDFVETTKISLELFGIYEKLNTLKFLYEIAYYTKSHYFLTIDHITQNLQKMQDKTF